MKSNYLLKWLNNNTVQYNDTTFKLETVPQADNMAQNGKTIVVYSCYAVDSEGNYVTITWLTKEDWNNEDESESCDWDSPYKIEYN